MNLRTTLLTGALAAALLAGSAVAVFAAPMMAQDTTLYSAPHGAEIDDIDGGDNVSVGKCQSGYCYVRDIDEPGTKGWVKSATIDFTGLTDDDDANNEASPMNDNGSLVDLSGIMGGGHHHHN